jgi:hypothetical protein
MTDKNRVPQGYSYDMLKALPRGEWKRAGHNTMVRHLSQPECVEVKLHQTIVAVLFPDKSVKINAGEWFTPTTADRINRCLSPIDWWVWLGNAAVTSTVWFKKEGDKASHIQLYQPGMILYPDGSNKLPGTSEQGGGGLSD